MWGNIFPDIAQYAFYAFHVLLANFTMATSSPTALPIINKILHIIVIYSQTKWLLL